MPTRITFDQLFSDDLWLYLLEFCEDVDLHVLEKVSSRFQILATDTILWRHIASSRCKERVSHLLTKPQRPERSDLVHHGILEGISKRHIDEGAYINGGNYCDLFQRVKKMNRFTIHKLLRKKLNERPGLDTLSQKNLIPQEFGGGIGYGGTQKNYHYHKNTNYTRSTTSFISTTSSKRGGNYIQAHSLQLSASLAPVVISLRKKLITDQLNQQLKKRIPFEEVKSVSKAHEIIISNTPYRGSLLPCQMKLHKHITVKTLNTRLSKRPSVEELAPKVFSPTASMVCPSIRPKVKFFEASAQNDSAAINTGSNTHHTTLDTDNLNLMMIKVGSHPVM